MMKGKVHKNTFKNRIGTSLMEVVTVVVIIGSLVGIAIPKFNMMRTIVIAKEAQWILVGTILPAQVENKRETGSYMLGSASSQLSNKGYATLSNSSFSGGIFLTTGSDGLGTFACTANSQHIPILGSVAFSDFFLYLTEPGQDVDTVICAQNSDCNADICNRIGYEDAYQYP